MSLERPPEKSPAELPPNLEKMSAEPRIVANPPLPDTSLVISVPFRGEYKNQNIPNLLYGMLNQKTAPGQSLEVEFIANAQTWGLVKYIDDEPYLSTVPPTDNEQTMRRYQKLQETHQAAAFIEKIVTAQKIARGIQQAVSQQDWRAASQLRSRHEQLLKNETQNEQRELLELAAVKANDVSIVLIDATSMRWHGDDPYSFETIDTFRTLGADAAFARFENKKEKVILSLWDADTLPENNSYMRELQEHAASNPSDPYFFSRMDYLPSQQSPALLQNAPAYAARQIKLYNLSHPYKGSPQICFRLSAYEKLGSIEGLQTGGFNGHEDFDTALRLMASLDRPPKARQALMPIARTADRPDGFMDSIGRQIDKDKEHSFTESLNDTLHFLDAMQEKITKEPPDRQSEIHQYLESCRAHYNRKEKVQWQFTRRVAKSLLRAIDDGLLEKSPLDKLRAHKDLLGLPASNALVRFIRSNRKTTEEILNSPDKQQSMKYLLGLTDTLPPSAEEDPFYYTMREYIGDMPATLNEAKSKTWQRSPDNNTIIDKRSPIDRNSLLYTTTAEIFALAQTHAAYFEQQIIDHQKKEGYPFPNPPLKYGNNFPERLALMKRALAKSANA